MTYKQIIKEAELLDLNEQKSLLVYLMSKLLELDTNTINQLLDIERKDKHKPVQTTNLAVQNILNHAGILEGIDLSDISEEEIHLQGD